MTLQEIETIVLANIGEDAYSSLSINSDRTSDFANLHSCVNLAREEIKLNTNIPAVNSIGTAIAVVANTMRYSLPADFDIPIAMYHFVNGESSVTKLDQEYSEDLPEEVIVQTVGASQDAGTPTKYLIAGTSANLLQVYLVPMPLLAGSIIPVYKPVLTTLSASTAEDTFMKKYPKVVIDFATAFAWQILKKDPTQHDKFYTLGLAECSKIDFREKKADSNYKDLPNSLLRTRRASRLSK